PPRPPCTTRPASTASSGSGGARTPWRGPYATGAEGRSALRQVDPAEDGELLAERHEVPSVVAVGGLDGLAHGPAGLGQLGAQVLQLGLEGQHLLDAGEVEALVGELGDAPELFDVRVGVPATAPAGA